MVRLFDERAMLPNVLIVGPKVIVVAPELLKPVLPKYVMLGMFAGLSKLSLLPALLPAPAKPLSPIEVMYVKSKVYDLVQFLKAAVPTAIFPFSVTVVNTVLSSKQESGIVVIVAGMLIEVHVFGPNTPAVNAFTVYVTPPSTNVDKMVGVVVTFTSYAVTDAFVPERVYVIPFTEST